ncbi:MAG TPA: glycosyltransferase [Gemmatimonadales bacterium]|nr:glycosyltransferase [Gemmatimonadales bacterium]
MHVVVASHHRLPVEGYGGPQRVVVALVRALAALGHRITLLAQPGTKVAEAAKIIEVAPRVWKDANVDLKKFLPDNADIMHAHFPLKQGPRGLPFVQTLHSNWKPNTPLPPNTVFLSRDHAARHGSTSFVYNGLDPAEYIYRGRKEKWDLFLGKLHSDRGYHWAVDAAKRTGRSLIIAGGWRPSFTGGIKYVGEVGGKRKAVLLARARCLWMPAQWDEPFGLPTIEALLSGTPVLGTNRGALPEIVTPDVGAIAPTLEEMIAASQTIETRSPEACRAHAERHFTHLRMAEGYVRMYEGLTTSGTLPAGRPAD